MFLPRSAVVLAGFLLASSLLPGRACGFGPVRSPSFRDQAAESKFIVFGKLENAKQGPSGGSTDFVIISILKPDPILDGQKVIPLPRYIPIDDPKKDPQLIAFGHVVEGHPDLFRGLEVTPAAVDYFKGLLAIKRSDRVKLMRYCFGWLEHADSEIAKDAFLEFENSDDADLCAAAQKFAPEKLRRWLKDERTPHARTRVYAILLANCGTDADAALLRTLLDKGVKEESLDLDGLLAAYTLMKPKDGWAYTRDLVEDASRSFLIRYAALRSVRYFFTSHPGTLTEKEVLELLRLTLQQPDLADLSIDELRRQECWNLTEQILGLFDKKGVDATDAKRIRRSVIRYALRCPDARAARFLKEVRKSDPDKVKQIENDLNYSEPRPVPRPRS